MSVLTKLFVVLLVISSLLLVGATVTAINKTEDWRLRFAQKDAAEKLAVAQKNIAESDRAAARAETDRVRIETTAAINLREQTISELNRQVVAAETERAKAERLAAEESAKLKVQQAIVAEMAKGAEFLNNEVKALRASNDELVRKNGQLEAAATDAQKKTLQQEATIRFLQEELTQARGQLQAAQDAIRNMGGAPVGLASTATDRGIGPTLATISGIIRDVREFRGNFYATISVGSADRVQNGMEFRVFSQSGDFMGILTVERVEPNEAFGRLQGPRVQDVRSDMPVRTQL